MGPAAQLFLKLIRIEKLPRWARTSLTLAVGMVLLYSVAVFVLTGASNMQVNVPYVLFLALCGVGGLGIGAVAWTHGKGGDSKTTASTPARVTPIPAAPGPSISQSTTGAQSPNVVGNPTIIYNAPLPSGPSPEEKKYREQLADEISVSRKSLDKSRNRWYTASVENRRPDAEKYWKESETRMGESAALLRKKVSTTGETEFLQIHPGEPVYPNLNRPYMPDGAAINEMWNRVARLTEIEKRVRNGTEPIKYPPPSP